MNTDERIALIKKTFNGLDKNNLLILNNFYDENIDFTDPIGNIKGLSLLKKYYAHVYANVISINFDFQQVNYQNDFYFAKWIMNIQVKGLNGGAPYPVEGFSVIKFNDHNKVDYHRDYLDLGSMVYENIPVLGKAIKLIKKKLG